jgi:co-chaperonin GroES (HSP10)
MIQSLILAEGKILVFVHEQEAQSGGIIFTEAASEVIQRGNVRFVGPVGDDCKDLPTQAASILFYRRPHAETIVVNNEKLFLITGHDYIATVVQDVEEGDKA